MSDDAGRPALRLAVIICTRDRPHDLRRSLSSLLRERPVGCQLLVVDQSRGTEAATVFRQIAGDSLDARYLASRRTGLSVARNQGAAATADSDLLLFTDDDCEVGAGWFQRWRQVFDADRSLGVGFGRVTTPPFDADLGHIPHFNLASGTRSWGLELFDRGAQCVGMGANMAVRRASWAAVGGFDEGLGAGSAFPAAEEIDLALRIVRGGYRLAHVDGPTVVHHGFRDSEAASQLAQGYAAATAAMYVKHLRCHDRGAARLLALESWHALSRVVRSVASGQHPSGFNSLRGFVRGMAASWPRPIDVERGVFADRVRGGSLA